MNIFLIVFIIIISISGVLALWFLRYCDLLVKHKAVHQVIKAEKDYMPYVSIIIPTYNEGLIIRNKLENTLDIDYPEKNREIIVVDSASSDDTEYIVKDFKSVILLTEKERKGKSHAIAEAFKRVRGELLLITDADAMLNRDVLEKMVPFFADATIGAATGKLSLVGKESKSKTSEGAYRTFFDILRIYESRMVSTMVFNGPLMLFRASIVEPPSMNSVADDTEMAFQVIRKGYRAVYIPDAVFFERVPASNDIRLSQKERRAQGLVQSFIRHRDMLFNGKYGQFGKVIFPAEFIVHILLPFALVFTTISAIISFFYEPIATTIVSITAAMIIMFYALSVYRKFVHETENKKKLNFDEVKVTVLSFIHLEFALFMGAVKLFIYGSNYKWEQIKEARVEDVKSR